METGRYVLLHCERLHLIKDVIAPSNIAEFNNHLIINDCSQLFVLDDNNFVIPIDEFQAIKHISNNSQYWRTCSKNGSCFTYATNMNEIQIYNETIHEMATFFKETNALFVDCCISNTQNCLLALDFRNKCIKKITMNGGFLEDIELNLDQDIDIPSMQVISDELGKEQIAVNCGKFIKIYSLLGSVTKTITSPGDNSIFDSMYFDTVTGCLITHSFQPTTGVVTLYNVIDNEMFSYASESLNNPSFGINRLNGELTVFCHDRDEIYTAKLLNI